MSISPDQRELGMNQPIARRDFLNGVAIGIATGVSALQRAQAQSTLTADEPALRTGLRGSYPAAVAEFDAIRLNSDAQLIPASSREVLF
jgi:spermidine dehydrogenase